MTPIVRTPVLPEAILLGPLSALGLNRSRGSKDERGERAIG